MRKRAVGLMTLGLAVGLALAVGETMAADEKETTATQQQLAKDLKALKEKRAAAKKSEGEKKKSTRPLQTSTVMKGLTKPNCDALRKILDKGPETSEDWEKLIEHSEVLSEVSFILMDDGRCPDYVWEGAAALTLRNCAKAIIAASEHRNIVVARGAFEKLKESCTSCHDAHKEKTSLLELVE
ncbi:MAG: hypothetical protein L3J39_05190 [Verrucomicrobiales bacterium]|nr:hypothetical protein [Verrucomicrobiales bacterium]